MNETINIPEKNLVKRVQRFLKDHIVDLSILVLFSGAMVTLDQLSKDWVRENIPLGTDWLPNSLSWLLPYARFRHTNNSGAAFGIFQQGGWIFAILAVIVSIMIISYFPSTSRKDWWLRLALGLQLGGAVGNLIDRIQFRVVTDFISVGSFAIFNVADACISVGVVILIIGVWILEIKEKKAKQQGEISEQ